MRIRIAVAVLVVAVALPVYAPPGRGYKPYKPYKPPKPVEVKPWEVKHPWEISDTVPGRSKSVEEILREWHREGEKKTEAQEEKAARVLVERMQQSSTREFTDVTFPWPDVMRESRDGVTVLAWKKDQTLEEVTRTRKQIYALNAAFATELAYHQSTRQRQQKRIRDALSEARLELLRERIPGYTPPRPLKRGLYDFDRSEISLLLHGSSSPELRAYRDVRKKPEFSVLSREMELYLARLAAGYDGRQAEAFADVVYARALLVRAKYDDVIQLAESTANRSGEGAGVVSQATISESTARLRGSVECIGYIAKSKKGTYDPIALFADYVALHAKSSHEGLAKDANEALAILTENCQRQIAQISGMQRWQRASAKLDIVGLADSAAHTYVFVKRGSRTSARADLAKKTGFDAIKFNKKTKETTFLRSEGAARAFLEHCYTTAKKFSTADFTLAPAFAYKGGYRVHAAGKTFRISGGEWKRLQAGEPLPDDHPITTHMRSDAVFSLYSHPLTEGEPRFNREIDALAFALRKAYPEAKIVKDDLTPETPAKAARVVTERLQLKNLVIVSADKSFNVIDYNAINNSRAPLVALGIPVVDFAPTDQWMHGQGKGVIVITGHTSRELARYVRTLGEAGVFRGNFVVFNSCEAELTSQLVAEINTRYGAIGTHAYEGKIPAFRVQNLLRSIASEIDAGKTEVDFERWWHDLVKQQQLNGVWMICQLMGEHVHG
jgi:hypothetical protein